MPTGRPNGRPSLMSQELFDEICERLANGESLRSICESDDMPVQSAIYRWLDSNPGFKEQYAQARVRQAHALAEHASKMASGQFEVTDPSFARLQMDAIKWVTGKLAPKVYGDKVDLNVGGQEDGQPLTTVIKWEK